MVTTWNTRYDASIGHTLSDVTLSDPLSDNTHVPIASVEVNGARGCDISSTLANQTIRDHALMLATTHDVIILTMALDQTIDREGMDSIETTLPGLQQEFIKAILHLNKTRTVLVLFDSGSVLVILDTCVRRTVAICDAYYEGQGASAALANSWYGLRDSVGKLATTVYPPVNVTQLPLTEMAMFSGFGRTHITTSIT